MASVGCVERRRADDDPSVVRGGHLGVRSEGNLHDARVEEAEELLGAQRRWAGFEPVDPAPHVGLEVDVGLEGESAVLDDRAHLVAQDPRHLLGRLDRDCPRRASASSRSVSTIS